MRTLLVLLVLFIAGVTHAAPDYAREQRWAAEITPTLVVGDALYLEQKAGPKFLALYTEVASRGRAVIIVHGLGVHPDWALIGALRTGLADAGYTTLSVQMPVLGANALGEDYPALFPEAAERIAAAVGFLRGKGAQHIALVAHSMGARMANYFLTQSAAPGVDAWVSVGISNGEFAAPAKLQLPVFDLYAERDFAPILQKAGARATVLRKLKGSAQFEVAGTDHFFTGNESELVKQVRQFLDRRLQ